MIEIASGVLTGFAGHYTDKVLVRINDPEWRLMARYIVGGVLIFFQGLLIFTRLNPRAWRDFAIALGGALASIGIGVGAARMYRGMTE